MRAELLLAAGAAMALLGDAALHDVAAAEPLVTLAVEGNPSCNSLAANQVIREIKFNSPTNGTLGSPPEQIEARFATGPNRVLSWKVVTNPGLMPVNIVIVKGQGGTTGAMVYHYGTAGALEGGNLLSPNNGSTAIASASFCYGLEDNTPPPPSQTVAACDLNDPGLQARCASGDPRFVLFKVDTSGGQYTVKICQCNYANGLQQCDPNATSKTDPSACISDQGLAAQLNQVNIVMEALNAGSYFCTTVGGTRTCFNVRR